MQEIVNANRKHHFLKRLFKFSDNKQLVLIALYNFRKTNI